MQLIIGVTAVYNAYCAVNGSGVKHRVKPRSLKFHWLPSNKLILRDSMAACLKLIGSTIVLKEIVYTQIMHCHRHKRPKTREVYTTAA